GQLVHAQGAEERVLSDALEPGAGAREDARLRAAEQLVSAECHYVHAGLQAFARRRFALDAVRAKVHQAPAAKVFDKREAQLPRELDHLAKLGPLGEAHDAEVAGMNAQQRSRALVEGRLKIRDARAVGGANLAKHGAALGANVGDAE